MDSLLPPWDADEETAELCWVEEEVLEDLEEEDCEAEADWLAWLVWLAWLAEEDGGRLDSLDAGALLWEEGADGCEEMADEAGLLLVLKLQDASSAAVRNANDFLGFIVPP